MVGLEALLPDTRLVLTKLSTFEFLKDFTFVGGSALAVHLNHRLSEDIDLFTWENVLNIGQLQAELAQMNFANIRAVSLSPKQCNYIIDGVKLTFFANNWEQLKESTPLINHVNIATLELLCTMKINTLFLRSKFRDYYDLYVLNKEKYSLSEMFSIASPQLNNLSIPLFQRALVFINDIQDEKISHLKPGYHVSLNQIEKHFVKQIKLWNALK
jgi:predicted nucleotidyltransferase component of viral defense system